MSAGDAELAADIADLRARFDRAQRVDDLFIGTFFTRHGGGILTFTYPGKLTQGRSSFRGEDQWRYALSRAAMGRSLASLYVCIGIHMSDTP